MPRPRKGRRVCSLPSNTIFGPINNTPTGEIIMYVDEYETIRLLDLEGLTQEQTAKRMEVARTTVQRIYASARQKVALALFEGSILKIEGGDYELYPANDINRGCRRCGRHGQGQGRGRGQGSGQGYGRGRPQA